MNNHVPNIERCKRLREAGFPQSESILVWVYKSKADAYEVVTRKHYHRIESEPHPWLTFICAAPIVTELIAEVRKAVPSTSGTWMEISVMEDGVFVNLVDRENAETYADTMPNALADLWLWLKERK